MSLPNPSRVRCRCDLQTTGHRLPKQINSEAVFAAFVLEYLVQAGFEVGCGADPDFLNFSTQIDLLREKRRSDRDGQPPKGWCIKNFAGNRAVNSGSSELFLVKLHIAFPKTPSGLTCLALLKKPRPIMGNSTGHS
ncbi:MAG: hypothetical protein ONB51_08175 [candidate division KSB1 bacterium]|nr:hypothetical protein [candidate division KSB1 bacterium]